MDGILDSAQVELKPTVWNHFNYGMECGETEENGDEELERGGFKVRFYLDPAYK